MDRNVFKQLLIAFFGVLLIGTLGYQIVEDWSLIDSFFMTVITITTVGYREIGGELSTPGKLFTVFLIFAGFGVAALALSHFTSSILRGELNNIVGRLRMRKEIESMKGHYIIGGFGRTGQVIANNFKVKKIPYVVIDNDDKSLRSLDEAHIPYVIGDAGDEEVLTKAGIERAKGFVAVVSSDANNAFAIMTARTLNTNLNIIARALDIHSVKKLKMAGANKVIAPYQLGGSRIAQAVAHPHSSDFIDIIENVEAQHIEMADLPVLQQGPFAGKTVGDPFFHRYDIIVIGIKKNDGTFVFHPKPEHSLKAHDHLIVMGPSRSIEELFSMAQST